MKKIEIETAQYLILIFDIILCTLYIIYYNRIGHISDSTFCVRRLQHSKP